MSHGPLKFIGFFLLPLFIILAANGTARAEEAEEKAAGEQAQGVIWLPKITFPPSDPNAKSGHLELYNRDLSYQYRRMNLYLSMKRGLELTIDKSDFYLRMGGRVYADLIKSAEDKNELDSDGFGLRKISIDMHGRFSKKWLYNLSWGGLTSGGKFDDSGAFLDNAYATHLGEKRAWIFGQHTEPFSLEQTTSRLAITFMERALPNAFVPGKNLGVSFHADRDVWGLSGGLFAEDLASAKDVSEQGLGLTGRFTYRPKRFGDKVYHLGGSFSWREMTGDDPIFFRTRPEAGLTDIRYVDTGDIHEANHVVRMGLEGALVAGALSFQVECMGTFIGRESGFDNLFFNGWYAFLSWFPTGESRKYFSREGKFGYPDISSKYGAVEVAARYSMLDLNDGSIHGGNEKNVTLGINWYVTPKLRIMGNAIFVFNDENADDNGKVQGDDDPQIYQLRFQARF